MLRTFLETKILFYDDSQIELHISDDIMRVGVASSDEQPVPHHDCNSESQQHEQIPLEHRDKVRVVLDDAG